MALMHSDDLYGESSALLLDLAVFLYATVIQQGGMVVLPSKEELQRLSDEHVLGITQDERTGDLILTVVPKEGQ